ncbi:MAG: cytochrome c oxidase subunit 4 [Chloroflexi bacterium]|nr:cytochrome c oxidase subunit 4 [Chloroflexota bacterium]MBV9543451.1 cytochrome c oxidase subunit 4 [Chloroflexota bacterium]
MNEEHLPTPSVWPFVVGAGLACAGLGIATSFALSGLGIFLFIWGMSGWIGDMRHAHE